MKCVISIFALLLCLATARNANAANIVLDWDASASPGVAGYNVYYGTNSGNYPYKMDAGSATSITISNLAAGTTYYFAATAYDGNGDESAYSAEISYLVPSFLTAATAANGAALPGSLTFQVAAGHWYEVQATTDFQNWVSIYQSDVVSANDVMQFTDPNAALYSSRFYRLVTH